jgi:hypothetical protein
MLALKYGVVETEGNIAGEEYGSMILLDLCRPEAQPIYIVHSF